MTYRFQDRLRHASDRFASVNKECVTYTAETRSIPINVSPILISSDELAPNNASMIRVERQDFAINVCELGECYPPAPGHKIRLEDGSEFLVSSMGTDEPPYVHTTSKRERIIVHTVRVRR